jgi:hypothetical protein
LDTPQARTLPAPRKFSNAFTTSKSLTPFAQFDNAADQFLGAVDFRGVDQRTGIDLGLTAKQLLPRLADAYREQAAPSPVPVPARCGRRGASRCAWRLAGRIDR